MPLKGLIGHPLPLSRSIQLMLDQARSEERQLRSVGSGWSSTRYGPRCREGTGENESTSPWRISNRQCVRRLPYVLLRELLMARILLVVPLSPSARRSRPLPLSKNGSAGPSTIPLLWLSWPR
ncbi:hypothetical protein [Ktedonobacter sp. SOSP1-52]|uniref:hypothetical protein n=1 Tax=Ktedonobacter sp. SOSP1-52 TaxID=2778366 RepID=UPI001F319D32|nr:hypothetical protein [Ktedonobacter sp. SOSP1-52]